MKFNSNFYLQIWLVPSTSNENLATRVSRFSAFRILVPLLYGFIMSRRKPFQIGPQQSSTKACFDENKQRNAFFTVKLSGHSDLPERVLDWFSQYSARYRRYQTKALFQKMISIRGTLPKGLPAHLVLIPNTYLIFRGAVRLTKPFVKQDSLLRS